MHYSHMRHLDGMRVLRAIAIHLTLAAGLAVQPSLAQLNEGPHLFHQKDGSVIAKWVTAGKIQTRQFAKGKPIELPAFASYLGKSLTLRTHRPEPAVWKLPPKMIVISDVEGQYATMRQFLEKNGVVDPAGKWAFGKGHLACLGDMVDRGQEVTETMWFLYRLAAEAEQAGGHLHYVMGNHEVMMMGGDVRYTARKYHVVAQLFGLRTEQLVGPDTEIGRWWRSFNTMTRVGPYLFVHAGISPTIAREKIDLDRFNAALRPIFGTPPQDIRDPALQLNAWGRPGPLWYRGYFADLYPEFGPTPTPEQLDTILQNVGARTILVGHTKVNKIAFKFGNRRVLPIDIPWTNPKKVRGVSIQGDHVEVLDIDGRREVLK